MTFLKLTLKERLIPIGDLSKHGGNRELCLQQAVDLRQCVLL